MMKYIGIFVCMLLFVSAFGSATIVNTTYTSTDEEKIYSYVLTTDEIQAEYNAGSPP